MGGFGGGWDGGGGWEVGGGRDGGRTAFYAGDEGVHDTFFAVFCVCVCVCVYLLPSLK